MRGKNLLTTLAVLAASCGRPDVTSDRVLNELVADSGSPVRYDANHDEYQLCYLKSDGQRSNEVCYVLRYSPFTGARLPSKRVNAFQTPTQLDIERLQQKIRGLTTIQDVERAFGPPDRIVRNGPSFRLQCTYTNLVGSAIVIIQEGYDGKLTVAVGGKVNRCDDQ